VSWIGRAAVSASSMLWLRLAASCAVYSPSDSSAAARWLVRRSAWATDGQGLSPKRSRTAAVVLMRRAARCGSPPCRANSLSAPTQRVRPAHERRGEVKAAPHATGVVLGHLAGGLGQVEPREQLGGALPCGARGQIKELADHDQVLRTGQVLVDRGELAGQPNALAYLAGLCAHVEPVDPGGPRISAQQRGENADGGGLARAIRPEHGEYAALAHREVHSGEGLRLAEGLGKPRGFNRKFCHDTERARTR
jgi:hypothetical protein